MSASFCSECGKRLDSSNLFCPGCGTKVAPPEALDEVLGAESVSPSVQREGESPAIYGASGPNESSIAVATEKSRNVELPKGDDSSAEQTSTRKPANPTGIVVVLVLLAAFFVGFWLVKRTENLIEPTQDGLRTYIQSIKGKDIPIYRGEEKSFYFFFDEDGMLQKCPLEWSRKVCASINNLALQPTNIMSLGAFTCAVKNTQLDEDTKMEERLCISNQNAFAIANLGSGYYRFNFKTGVPFFSIIGYKRGIVSSRAFFSLFPDDSIRYTNEPQSTNSAMPVPESAIEPSADEGESTANSAELAHCARMRVAIKAKEGTCLQFDTNCHVSLTMLRIQLSQFDCRTPAQKEEEARLADHEVANRAAPRPQAIVVAIENAESKAAAVKKEFIEVSEAASRLNSELLDFEYAKGDSVETSVGQCQSTSADVRDTANSMEGYDDKGAGEVASAATKAAKACENATSAIENQMANLDEAHNRYIEAEGRKRADAVAQKEQTRIEFEGLVQEADDLYRQRKYTEALALYLRIQNSYYTRYPDGDASDRMLTERANRARDRR